MTDKTTAEMLREVLAGMTERPWRWTIEDAPDERLARCRWSGRILTGRRDIAYTNPHDGQDSPDVRGIVTFVNCADELVALVESLDWLIRECENQLDFDVEFQPLVEAQKARDALTAKLREQGEG